MRATGASKVRVGKAATRKGTLMPMRRPPLDGCKCSPPRRLSLSPPRQPIHRHAPWLPLRRPAPPFPVR
jgi:hypothetical protein